MNLHKVKLIATILSIFCVAFSCMEKENGVKDTSILKKIEDHYDNSKNENLSITDRIKEINSAYKLSNMLDIDTLGLKTLNYKAFLIKNSGGSEKYYQIINEYLNLAIESNNNKHIGKAYYKIADYYFYNRPDSAYYYFNKSKIIHHKLNDSLSVGKRLISMAIVQANESDYYGSEKTAVEALKYLKESNKRELTSAYNCLAITTSELKNYDDALYWTNKCQDLQNNETNYNTLQNNKANYLIEKKEYSKAKAILISLLKSKKLNELSPYVKSNLGYIYLKQNNGNEALPLLEESLSHWKKTDNTYDIIESYRRLSEFHETYSDFTRAGKYADSAYAVSIQASNLNEKVKTLKRKLDFAKGDAYKILSQIYIKWNDRVQNETIANRDLFAKIKYDTEKNRYENLILNEKIIKNDLKITKETYRRNLGIIISSLLIIIVGFIIHNWRQRIKIASFNAVTKTEKRISKKVHDEMANDISNIKTLIKNQLPSSQPIKKQLLNMLDITYTNARDIASETGEIIFSDSFGADLKNVLMQHNNEHIKIILSISGLNQLKIDQHKKNAIYRILQELMVNMNKHSKATRVIIAHKKEGKHHEIRYSDNGVGTDAVNLNNGLQNASTRMKDIRGSFSFETSKGNGFKAILKFKA